MKNYLLVALNAKYSHTSLSVRSINAYVKNKLNIDIPYLELTINNEYFYILNEILKSKPDVVGFSCYIWNIELIKSLVKDIKSINPEIEIFLGGPEVTYNENVFFEIPEADFVIKGEGEIPLYKLLKGEKDIEGVWYKDKETGFAEMEDLDKLPFPYTEEELLNLKNRAVYYETSRGCPFKCAFCISSLTKGVRVLPLERVYKEIDMFIKAGITRVKLVDRTFNFDKERAKKIILYILRNSENTCFHFEIGADLLDKELIDIILSAKKDIIQLEAGIQSTNEETLSLCNRTTDMKKLKDNLIALTDAEIRIHLDLIAGLPGEDYESFKNSFNEAFALKPKVLQVGFLKLLHGSELRNKKEEYGYSFRNKAPYEVLKNNYITFDELMEIKKVDKSVDTYNNSGIFTKTLKYIFENNNIEPFSFFHTLGENMGNDNLSLKSKFLILFSTYNNIIGEDEELKKIMEEEYKGKNKFQGKLF